MRIWFGLYQSSWNRESVGRVCLGCGGGEWVWARVFKGGCCYESGLFV